MERTTLGRRDFNRMTMAALGGVLAGTLPGCPKTDEMGRVESGSTLSPSAAPPAEETNVVSLLLEEPHVCRGLNTCKGLGASKDNACAGQGTCASVEHHLCHAHNACKGQGGCGANPGENACKGQGGCAVPLMDHAWDTARKNFEAAMQKAGKDFSPAPPKS